MAASKEDLDMFADAEPAAPAAPSAPRATDDDLAMFMDRVTEPHRMNQPREYTDEQLGIDTKPEPHLGLREFLGIPSLRSMFPSGAETWQKINAEREAAGLPPAKDPMEGDPIAQGVVTSTALGPVGGAVARGLKPVLGVATAPVVGAAEGAAASKMTGGDALPGALLGAGLGALGAAVRASTPAAAKARGTARLEKDIHSGVPGSAAGKEARDTIRAHGTEKIGEIGEEIPSVGKALKTQAHTNPAAAQKAVDKALAKVNDANDAAYAAMQRQHGGMPLQPLAERAAALEARLNEMGLGVEADAVNRIRTDWLKRYAGDPNKGLADVKLTMQQVRNMRNDLRKVADPTKTMDANTKRSAANRVANIMNKEIEDVAEQTRGVDVESLRMRNRQIATLTDVADTLEERALKMEDSQAGLMTRVKRLPGRAAARAGREFDYQLGRLPDVAAPQGRVPVSPLVQTQEQRRRNENFQLRLADALGVQ